MCRTINSIHSINKFDLVAIEYVKHHYMYCANVAFTDSADFITLLSITDDHNSIKYSFVHVCVTSKYQ